jgi:KDO2-lipid IV(A) lauroyltransferase
VGRSRKPVRDTLLTMLGKALLFVCRWFPWSLGYFFGGIVGRLTYQLSQRERNRALQSLAIAYEGKLSEKERKKLGLRSFQNMGRILFEMMKLPGLSKKTLLKRVSLADSSPLDKAKEAGQGVIIATGHIGNWEIMGAAAVQYGYKLHVIAREIHIAGFNKMVIELRKKAGIETIVRNSEASAKKILTALKRQEMLAMLIDQDIAAEGDFVPFFGTEALTPTGAARLALKTESAFVAACCHRVGIGRFEIKLQEVEINREMGDDEAVLDATARATEILEDWIREYPDQWPWIHQRWKTRPQDEIVNEQG